MRYEALRLMRARPAGAAAGGLLRAAKHAVACGDFEAQPILDLSQAVARFEAAERAGVR